jgi:hypothetical protein
MTTKSQEAFEQHYSGYHDIANEDFSKTDGLYNLSYLHRDYEKWQAAEASGYKQALEEAVEICKKEWLTEASDYQYDRGWSNAAKRIVKNLQELIK